MNRLIKLKRKFPASCPRLDQSHVIHNGKIFVPRGYLDNRLIKVVLFLELVIFMSFWFAILISDFRRENPILFIIISFPLVLISIFLLYQQFISLMTKYYSRREKEPRKMSVLYRKYPVELLRKYLKERETPCYEEYKHCTDFFSK